MKLIPEHIKQLNERDRLIFTLRYYEGASIDTISVLMGIKRKNIKKLLKKIKNHLYDISKSEQNNKHQQIKNLIDSHVLFLGSFTLTNEDGEPIYLRGSKKYTYNSYCNEISEHMTSTINRIMDINENE